MTTSDVATNSESNVVFVVHGRNLEARDAVFDFLLAIGLHPLEWSEAILATGKAAPHAGEILDAAFSKARAVVVLLTPDDEARLRVPFHRPDDLPHETNFTGQARPNVLFEAGLAMARHRDRTVLVELGNLRPFSDIAGLQTIRIDDTAEKRQEFAQRLRAAGCPINTEGKTWYRAGQFEAAIHSIGEVKNELAENTTVSEVGSVAPQLSGDAAELLLEATTSDGNITNFRTLGGAHIGTNSREFSESGNARSEARWASALGELHKNEFIRPLSPKEEMFSVTHEGYQVADRIRDRQD